jgi:hypothetical protein
MNRLQNDWRNNLDLPELISLRLNNGVVSDFQILPKFITDFTLDDVQGIVNDLVTLGNLNLTCDNININIWSIDETDLVYIETFHYNDNDESFEDGEHDVPYPLHEFLHSGEIYYES